MVGCDTSSLVGCSQDVSPPEVGSTIGGKLPAFLGFLFVLERKAAALWLWIPYPGPAEARSICWVANG